MCGFAAPKFEAKDHLNFWPPISCFQLSWMKAPYSNKLIPSIYYDSSRCSKNKVLLPWWNTTLPVKYRCALILLPWSWKSQGALLSAVPTNLEPPGNCPDQVGLCACLLGLSWDSRMTRPGCRWHHFTGWALDVCLIVKQACAPQETSEQRNKQAAWTHLRLSALDYGCGVNSCL